VQAAATASQLVGCLRQTLFECTPPHSFALSGRFDADHEEEKTVKNSGSKLNAAIADIIHDHGLPFSLSESPCFERMLRLAKFAPPGYEPPNRKLVGGRLLAVNFKEYHDRILERLALQAGFFGLSLLGDGATVKRMPLVNMLDAGVHEPAGVLEISECTGHIQGGGKKDSGFIAGLFLPHMKIIDPDKQLIDCVFFYGSSNVQKAEKIMQVHYPRVMVLHGAEHVVSLFFKDLYNIQVVKHHIVRHRFIYRVFGSGAMHSPYVLFQRHARAFNNGRPIGLLRESYTRMAGYFMAMHRDLRLKQALQATAAGSDFISLKISK
jgi:hypothetical protein